MLPDAGRPPEDLAPSTELPLMPWEEPGVGLFARLWATLGSAFHPLRDVARVSHGPVGNALSFALWSAVPAAFASGIIPLTQLLMFDKDRQVHVLDGADDAALVFDVLRAGSLGLAVSACAWLLSAYAFVSLARAFSKQDLAPTAPDGAAWRSALYRAWLLPAGMAGFWLAGWLGPELNQTRVELLALAFHVLPGVILMLNYSGVARYLGASSFAGLAAAFVPVLVYQLSLDALNRVLIVVGWVVLPEAAPTPE